MAKMQKINKNHAKNNIIFMQNIFEKAVDKSLVL